ncbi:MAG: hypothetical protein RSC05_13255 [Acinetobacter sp.]
MIDPAQDIGEKKLALQNLAAKAKKQTEGLGCENSALNENSAGEQKMLEGKQGGDEQLVDDLKTAIEDLTSAVECIDTRSKDLQNDLQEQLIVMRETYASKAYRFVWLWSIALIVILVLQGSDAPSVKLFSLQFNAHTFNLSDKVLIALISGVTVNIVAVFVVVIRNLFPSEHKVNPSKEKK